jgi:hypothetical protein
MHIEWLRIVCQKINSAAAANCQFHLKICAAASEAAYIFKDMQLPFKFTTTTAQKMRPGSQQRCKQTRAKSNLPPLERPAA